MSMTIENEEFVNLPVPKRVYPFVARALAEALAETPDASVKRVRGWTADEMATLASVVKNEAVLVLLDMTARRPGQWVTFDEFCAHAGRTKRQAMGDLAGFTQLINHRLKKIGHNKDVWPIEVVWNEQGSPSYRMPDEIARWWKEAFAA